MIHDDERDSLQKRPLQSILYAFLGKKQNIAPLVTYDRILHQAADIIKRGVTTLAVCAHFSVLLIIYFSAH